MTTKDPFYKLGYNMLCLRKGFDETASDVGDAIGVGKSSISEYETGSKGKVPHREKLVYAAKHFGVTVDDLIERDYTGFTMGNYEGITIPMLKELRQTILPIVSSSKALRNSSFKKAYERHKGIYKGLENNVMFEENDLVLCLRWYEKASTEGVSEASANILWWLIVLGQPIVEEHLLDGYQAMFDGMSTFGYLIKNGALPNYGENNPHQISREQMSRIREYASDIDDDYYRHLKVLKQSEHADLGDYYLAFRYVSALPDNDRSIEANRTMGVELMQDLLLLGNKYARSYFLALEKIKK